MFLEQHQLLMVAQARSNLLKHNICCIYIYSESIIVSCQLGWNILECVVFGFRVLQFNVVDFVISEKGNLESNTIFLIHR